MLNTTKPQQPSRENTEIAVAPQGCRPFNLGRKTAPGARR